MRRTAILAALLAACAPKPIRPAPDVELVQATPISAGHALLIFKDPSPFAHPRCHLARHAVDGQLAWQRRSRPATSPRPTSRSASSATRP